MSTILFLCNPILHIIFSDMLLKQPSTPQTLTSKVILNIHNIYGLHLYKRQTLRVSCSKQ